MPSDGGGGGYGGDGDHGSSSSSGGKGNSGGESYGSLGIGNPGSYGGVNTSAGMYGGYGNVGQGSASSSQLAQAAAIGVAKAQAEAARQQAILDKRTKTGLIETDWMTNGVELSDALKSAMGTPTTAKSSWGSLSDQPQQSNSSQVMARQSPNEWDDVKTTYTNNFPMDRRGTSWGHNIGNALGAVVGGPIGSLVAGGLGGLLGSNFDKQQSYPENSFNRNEYSSGLFGGQTDRATTPQKEQSTWVGRTAGDAVGMLGGLVGTGIGGVGLGNALGAIGNKAGNYYGNQAYEGGFNPSPSDRNFMGNSGMQSNSSGNGDGRNPTISLADVSMIPPTTAPKVAYTSSPRYQQQEIPSWLRDLYKDGNTDISGMENYVFGQGVV